MNLLKAIFGRCAEDVEYYTHEGYPHALCVDHEDALQVALQTATGRYNMTNIDMFVSPPYREFECPGYIVLKNEEAAAGIQQEILRSGFERGLNFYKPLKLLHNFTQKHYTCK